MKPFRADASDFHSSPFSPSVVARIERGRKSADKLSLDLQLHIHQVLQADGMAKPHRHARADEGRFQGGAEKSVFG